MLSPITRKRKATSLRNVIPDLQNPVIFSGPLSAGGQMRGGGFFLDMPATVPWTVHLPEAGWLHAAEQSPTTGIGPAIFLFSADPNPGAVRSALIRIEYSGKVREHTITQQSGSFTKTEGDTVLDLPFLLCPRVMEFAILFKWVTEMVKKIPMPWRLIVLVIVEVVVVLAGVALVVLVEALKKLVPQSPTPFSWPDMPTHSSVIPMPVPCPFPQELTSHLDVTPSLIAMQTIVSGIYIAIETLS